MNTTVSPLQGLLLTKPEAGEGSTTNLLVTVPGKPALLNSVSLTVYVPGVLYTLLKDELV